MVNRSRKHIGDRLDTTMRMPGESRPIVFGNVIAEIVPQPERPLVASLRHSTRTFIAVDRVHFRDWPFKKDDATSFEQLFPGASGIISFSHVGFDSTLDEAVVSTSICGGLCGPGQSYFLKKKRGRWEVAAKSSVWVS